MSKRVYGLKGPDRIDHRDFILSFSPKFSLPNFVSLRAKCCPIFEQGQLSSCVANAAVGIMQFNDKLDDNQFTALSRLMLYYLCRKEDGDVNDDNGTYARTAVRVLAKYGTCKEELWPYIIDKFKDCPNQEGFADAINRRIYAYHRIITLFDMQACLASGKLFMMGIPVFPSFESDEVAQTGKVPMPTSFDEMNGCLGYHEVYCCGYDNKTKRMECVNSWGDWGDHGFFTLPYSYVKKYVVPQGVGDCWTITRQML